MHFFSLNLSTASYVITRPDELYLSVFVNVCLSAEGVTGAVEDTAGKVNVLLQSYIDQSRIKSFTLISDTNYVAQSAGRISRA